jgi:hypothetical protein
MNALIFILKEYYQTLNLEKPFDSLTDQEIEEMAKSQEFVEYKMKEVFGTYRDGSNLIA